MVQYENGLRASLHHRGPARDGDFCTCWRDAGIGATMTLAPIEPGLTSSCLGAGLWD